MDKGITIEQNGTRKQITLKAGMTAKLFDKSADASDVDIKLEAGSTLEHFRLLTQAHEVAPLYGARSLEQPCRIHVTQNRDSSYRLQSLLANCTQREEITITHAGPHAQTRTSHLAIGKDTEKSAIHVKVIHNEPEGASETLYRAILDQNSQGTFEGITLIKPDAQKTAVRQNSRILLLSENAAAFPSPQLEIEADDVKASHGSSVGQLDVAALFYLESRGIPPVQASQLLTEAFANEWLKDLPEAGWREEIEPMIAKALSAKEALA